MSSNTTKNQPKLNFTGTKPQTKPAVKKYRPDTSDNSNSSMDELNSIHVQLQAMTDGISSLREDLKSMLRKDEIEQLITNAVTSLMHKMEQNMNKNIDKIVNEKCKEMQERIDSLDFENKGLKDTLQKLENNNKSNLKSLQEQIDRTDEISRMASKKANYNEQFSRKNNIKIQNIPESKDENEESLTKTVTGILKTHAEVDLQPIDTVAMHRIPTKQGQTRPVLIKLRNNSIKSAIMKKRAPMKNGGYKLVDDVTKPNQGLISRLHLHPDIQSAWYFNGAVYGQTVKDERIKFDIYDNVTGVIEEFRQYRRNGMQSR